MSVCDAAIPILPDARRLILTSVPSPRTILHVNHPRAIEHMCRRLYHVTRLDISLPVALKLPAPNSVVILGRHCSLGVTGNTSAAVPAAVGHLPGLRRIDVRLDVSVVRLAMRPGKHLSFVVNGMHERTSAKAVALSIMAVCTERRLDGHFV